MECGLTNVEPILDSLAEPLISSDEFKKRLVELCAQSRITTFPRKYRDRHILFKSVTLTLDVKQMYTEVEINDGLRRWLADVAPSLQIDHLKLRRWMIEEFYIGRQRDGSRYWLAVFGPPETIFEPDVDVVDVYETLSQGRRETARRKQQYVKP